MKAMHRVPNQGGPMCLTPPPPPARAPRRSRRWLWRGLWLLLIVLAVAGWLS